MRFLLCALLALVGSSAMAQVVAQAPVVQGVPGLAPLTELGCMLRGSLSGTQSLSAPLSPTLGSPGTLPTLAALDPVRASILLERVQALETPKPAAAIEPAKPAKAHSSPSPAQARGPVRAAGQETGGRARPEAGARELLVAVNSVFQDISPEKMKDMPAEELSGLAGLVLDQLQPGRSGAGTVEAGEPMGAVTARRPLPERALEAVALLSRARLGRLDSMSGKPVKETPLNPYPEAYEPDIRIVEGTPPFVRVMSEDERSVTFRHYTSAEGLRAILDGDGLSNGWTPYMLQAGRMAWKSFKDLTGIFLTLPGVPGGKVGVGKSPAYVDLKVPKGLPVLEIEPGSIFLIPMPGRVKASLREKFLSWIRGEPLKPYETSELEKVDKDGGPGPSLRVPVEIVGHSPF